VSGQSIWLRPERAGHGPAPEHSRARIAAVAVGLADQGGLSAVSMRKVAAALDAGAASLYRYVATRDELLALMADAVTGELGYPKPTSGDWRADLIGMGQELRGLYAGHPWMLDVQPGPTALGPNGVAFLEQALAALAPLDRPGNVKLEAVAMLSGSVSLFARNEASGGGDGAEARAATAAYLGTVIARGEHPHLAAALASPAPPGFADPETLFARVLGGLLAGILGV
jgi:AcrR family transcriptional regulator